MFIENIAMFLIGYIITQLILHNKWALNYHIWKMQKRNHRLDGTSDCIKIKLINGISDWKRGCLSKHELNKKAFTAIRRQNSWTCDLNWVEKMQEYAKHIAQWILGTFYGSICICLDPETVPRNRPKFWRKSTR